MNQFDQANQARSALQTTGASQGDQNQAYFGATNTAMMGAIPQAIKSGATRLSQSPNRILSTIGKIIKMPISLVAPSDEEAVATERIIGGNQATPEDVQLMKKKALAPVMGMTGEVNPVSKLPQAIQRVLGSRDEILNALQSAKVGFRLSPTELDLEQIDKMPQLYRLATGEKVPRGMSLTDMAEGIKNAYQSALQAHADVTTEALQAVPNQAVPPTSNYVRGQGGRFNGSRRLNLGTP